MTPEQTIRDAYQGVPADWPGRRDGLPIRRIARGSLAAISPLPIDAIAKPVSFFPIEFRWGLEGRSMWRIVGKWRDTEITVDHGPI